MKILKSIADGLKSVMAALTAESWEERVAKDPHVIAERAYKPERLLTKAVTADWTVIFHIDSPSRAVSDIVRNNSDGRQYLLDRQNLGHDQAKRLYDLKAADYDITQFPEPTNEMILRTVKNRPMRIKDVADQTEELQMMAVKADPDSIGGIRNPFQSVQSYIVGICSKMLRAVYELPHLWPSQEEARKAFLRIKDINNPSEQTQLEAVSLTIPLPESESYILSVYEIATVLTFFPNASMDVKWKSIRNNGYSVQYVPDADEEMHLAAVRECSRAISVIKDPSESVRNAAETQSKEEMSDFKQRFQQNRQNHLTQLAERRQNVDSWVKEKETRARTAEENVRKSMADGARQRQMDGVSGL
jgi:hypothetical protein